MMPAAKHFDPVLGVDIHIIQPPGPVPPVPVPHPFVGFIIDPFDYAPIIGATVLINGMYRALAGTMGKCVPPHIPIGGVFVKPPANECEMFMGSSTVCIDGDAQSYLALPALSCHCVGMPPVPRLKKKGGVKSMVLPTSVVLPIPAGAPVLIGGPPTISLMALGMKVGMAGLGKAFKRLAKSNIGKRMGKAFKKAKQKMLKNMKPGFLKCKVLKAEPVDITSGEVVVDQQDFSIPGRIPIDWNRHYGSHSDYQGVCGYGWETPADARLEVDEDGVVLFCDGSAGALVFASLPGNSPVTEPLEGAVLDRAAGVLRVRLKDGLTYEFPQLQPGERRVLLARMQDLCGNYLEFVRDRNGLRAISESAGRRIDVTSRDGRIYGMQLRHPDFDEPCPLVRYDYSDALELVTVHDALDRPCRFAYLDHRLVRHTDRNGLSFYYEFDRSTPEWRCAHSWGDGGLYDYRFEYDGLLNATRVTDSLGYVSTVQLDERGLPISETDPLGGRTAFEYDEVGRTTAVVAPGGQRTEYEYDARGNLVKLTRPDGTCTVTEFDEASRAVKMTDPTGALWQQEWNARGLIARQTSPLGAESQFEYDTHGQLIRFTNPNRSRTTLQFDAIGNLIRLTDAQGNRTEYAYDPLGNVTRKIDPLNQITRYGYDGKGRLSSVNLPSGASIACSYDGEDNLLRYVDENGAETRMDYAGLGEIKRRIESDGQAIEYHYDSEERLIGVSNQRGERYELHRDALGRIVEEVDYWGQTRQFTYDASGYLTSSTDPMGRTIKYLTDPLGRIVEKLLPGGLAETFAFDANDNVVESSNPDGSVKREFDAEGRLIKEVQGTFTITSTYDANGNRVARATSLGNSVVYEFDGLDQVVAVCINRDEPIRIERDAAGRIAQETLSPNLSRRFGYSAEGYLAEQAVAVQGAARFATRYEYDRAGNLSRRTDSQFGSDTYSYDRLGQISEHLDPQGRITRYLNDPAGDRLRSRVAEAAVCSVAGEQTMEDEWRREGEYDGTSYQFDRAGNLVRRRDDLGEMHLVWDANQRLIESRANGAVTRYGYDAFGRRIFKETGDRRVAFYWDGDALMGESLVVSVPPQESARDAREYVHYPETFEPLAVIGGAESAAVLFFHNDPNGCPTRITDADGEVKWAAHHSIWGKVNGLHVHALNNPIRLQGQYEDEETGFAQNLYRYFDAQIGVFISQDPLGLVVGPNPYQYAPNAVGWADPLGLACGPAVRQNVKGRWIDAQGKFARAPNVSSLPRFKGRSVKHVEDILQSRGYTRTNPANPKNQRWVHPDGSEVQIHAYGNAHAGPYKAGNNAHAHKSLGRHGNPGTTELADDGMTSVSTHSAAAHIGLRNPADFPTVAGRPHGT